MTTASASFLTSGPWIELDLPDELLSTPHSECPIDFGAGGRTVIYEPHPFDGDLDHPTHRFLGNFDAAGGRSVEVWESSPERSSGVDTVEHFSWMLRWPVSGGSVYTHVRDLEGRDTVDVVRASLEVLDTEPATVIVHAPLTRGASLQPGYSERLRFQGPASGSGPAPSMLTIARPEPFTDGEIRTRRAADRVIAAVGGPGDVAVMFEADSGHYTLDDATSIAQSVADQLRGQL